MPHAGHGGGGGDGGQGTEGGLYTCTWGGWGTRNGGWTVNLHMGGDGGQGTEGGLYTCTWGGGRGMEGGLYTCTWLGADCGCDVSLACSELVCACWVAVASMAAILCGGGALIMFNGVIYTSCMTCPYLLLTKDVVQG